MICVMVLVNWWRAKMSERDMERLLDEVFAKVFGDRW